MDNQDEQKRKPAEEKQLLSENERESIGPKQDDPRSGIAGGGTRNIGPKQDDPVKRTEDNVSIGPKQDDPRAKYDSRDTDETDPVPESPVGPAANNRLATILSIILLVAVLIGLYYYFR